MENLLLLKEELETPGTGKHRHDIAEKFKHRKDVPIKWIRKWLSTEWYVIGHQYLWLSAMNSCVGRSDIPINLIYQGLRKTDRDTFMTAIEACRGRKISSPILRWWYDSSHVVLQLAAITACIDNSSAPKRIIHQAKSHQDIRIQRIANQILD